VFIDVLLPFLRVESVAYFLMMVTQILQKDIVAAEYQKPAFRNGWHLSCRVNFQIHVFFVLSLEGIDQLEFVRYTRSFECDKDGPGL